MDRNIYRIIGMMKLILLSALFGHAQNARMDSVSFYNEVKTYVNPVLPGDHPDPTPYLPVYHSKDMVHWEVISRIVLPSKSGWVTDRPSAGIWQGAINYYYGSFWIYFSANGQWFSKADFPYDPWSEPVQVKTNPTTGAPGYDNLIFVDDFPAGDVSGGQYVLRGTALTPDSTKWKRLGEFFKPVTDSKTGFRRPNHISAPFQLADGTWWTIGQSYEKYDADDWSGLGRQTLLFNVIRENDRPWSLAPTTKPVVRPNLPQAGIIWRSVNSDYFDSNGAVTGGEKNFKAFKKVVKNVTGRHDVFVKFPAGSNQAMFIKAYSLSTLNKIYYIV